MNERLATIVKCAREMYRGVETIDILCREIEKLDARRTVHEQVLAFHEAFGQPIGKTGPQYLTDERMRLRLRLIAEEFFELLTACGNRDDSAERTVEGIINHGRFTAGILNHDRVMVDMAGLVDALGDLDYVIEGMRIEMGIDGGPIAAEIHRSNMAKLGPDGKPVQREDGKIVKPPTWTPPDLLGVLATLAPLGNKP